MNTIQLQRAPYRSSPENNNIQHWIDIIRVYNRHVIYSIYRAILYMHMLANKYDASISVKDV